MYAGRLKERALYSQRDFILHFKFNQYSNEMALNSYKTDKRNTKKKIL